MEVGNMRTRADDAAALLALKAAAPADAKALIIAELHEDTSEPVSDYYGSRTVRIVALGWSKTTRNSFPELRKWAATFDETEDLAKAPASVEHREMWSMGKGFYLAFDGYSGWKLNKLPLSYANLKVDANTDLTRVLAPALPPPVRPGPAFTPADTAIAPFAHVDPPTAAIDTALLALKKLLAAVKPSFYSTPAYAAAATHEDAMGLLLARFFEHDGAAILRTAASALEDANFRTESEVVTDMAAKVEAL
jgi:hypothetical protein